MKALISVITIIFVLIQFELRPQVMEIDIPESAKKLQNPFKKDPKAINKGAIVYKKVCWTCHGDGGKGTGPQAAELETKPADFNDPKVVARTDGELYYWIGHGGGEMQAFNEALTDEEIWKVVTYVRKLQNK
jgi:mono/diheme cytochrome c family protein